MSKYLYRFEAHHQGEMPRVFPVSYPVTKITEKGYWIDIYGRNRWVAKVGTKKYAHETMEEALDSFIYRRNRQNKIMKVIAARNDSYIDLCKKERDKLLNELPENRKLI